MKKAFLFLNVTFLLLTTAPLQAAETVPTRDELIATYHAQWDARWAALHDRILATKTKAYLDSSVKKMYLHTLDEYLDADETIKENLASKTYDLTGLSAYVDEEYNEYSSYIFQVEKSISKYKTIACVKGSTKKKVTNLAPKCPTGYKKG